ncbi:hypothetical protein LJR289_002563 [Pseudoduganella sp. LjRoot289]|uniref:hypothetical protein n=1 Tax=Pseudoduganella sp. LjRoot289 TaxID=3342314 RepID=UPI003ECCA29A
MKRISLLLFAAAGVPLFVHAQSVRMTALADDASAAVPALRYQSVFAARQADPKPLATPDKVWLEAIQDSAAGSGHGAHAMHGAHGAAAKRAPAPAAPSAASSPAPAGPAAAPADDPHKGHDMNMKGH